LGGDDATRILPSTTPLPTDETQAVEPGRKKRSPWTWPLIALIALLLLALGGTLLAWFNNNDKPGPVESSATQSQTPTPKPTKSTPPPVATVDIAGLGLIDKTCNEATGILIDNGFPKDGITCAEGNPAGTEEQQSLVYKIDPSGGPVKVTTPVTLTVYAGQTAIPTPTDEPALSGEPVAGSTVTLSWGAGFQCPNGYQPAGYSVLLANATWVDGDGNFPDTIRSAEIVIGDAVGQQVTASYAGLCKSVEGGTRTSDQSPQLSETIVAADPGPTPGSGENTPPAAG
ncbi:MAG: serine/threonine protein kinase, partial [Microbacterium sp.]